MKRYDVKSQNLCEAEFGEFIAYHAHLEKIIEITESHLETLESWAKCMAAQDAKIRELGLNSP